MTIEETGSDVEKFSGALKESAGVYGVALNEHDRLRLSEYYSLVVKWNRRLHLVAPCAPAEFATRHVLESLLLLPYLPLRERVVDVGSGAGLPIMPCLLVRPDLEAVLVEASLKKGIFLREATDQLKLRAQVVVDRFEKTNAPQVKFLTCRALERFQEMLPQLVAWPPISSTFLLFGGHNLRARLEQLNLPFVSTPIPKSEGRFLFVVNREQ